MAENVLPQTKTGEIGLKMAFLVIADSHNSSGLYTLFREFAKKKGQNETISRFDRF